MQLFGIVSRVSDSTRRFVVELQPGGHAVFEMCEGGCPVTVDDAIAGRLAAPGVQKLANLSEGAAFTAFGVTGFCTDVVAMHHVA